MTRRYRQFRRPTARALRQRSATPSILWATRLRALSVHRHRREERRVAAALQAVLPEPALVAVVGRPAREGRAAEGDERVLTFPHRFRRFTLAMRFVYSGSFPQNCAKH